MGTDHSSHLLLKYKKDGKVNEINIQEIQSRLSDLGFNPGPIDGIRGPRTDFAIRAFKRSIGLRDRPYIGPLTYAALMNSAPQSELPWMAAALKVKGLHEGRNTSRLRGWFDKSVSWIDPREVPWCGAFVATCHRIADSDITIPDNPLGARNWGNFGKSCAPVLGATLTFWRGSRSGWKGHVGFYWGEDSAAFHVLGGNQANAVTITRVAKSRLLQSRWPSAVSVTGSRVLLNASGQPLSENEA